MLNAETKYRQLIGKQSTTLQAAVAEYKRRYNRNPPRGFDEWFAFAQAHDVKIIDEYDGLVRDLAPFWNLPVEDIRRRAQQVRDANFPTGVSSNPRSPRLDNYRLSTSSDLRMARV